MTQTALHSGHPAAAETGLYNGVETALSFGSPAGELAALRSGCGIFALPWRKQVQATGKDRVRWLHNMVTNTVRDLALDHGNYNFVLNAQGRILGDLYIFNRGESLLLETDAAQTEPLINTLKRFIIMDKVELTPLAERVAVGLCGPRSEETLVAAGIDAHGLSPLSVRNLVVEGQTVTLIAGPEKKPGWFELWLNAAGGPDAPASAEALWRKLLGAGARPVGAGALEMWRVLRGIPCYGQDIRDRDLPQETGQTDALHFSKGCYIGQEIVERIRSRGQVHRKFTGFKFPAAMPAPGKYEAAGRAVAEITSVARVPAGDEEMRIGLGYVRQEALAAGPGIDLNGVAAEVVELPFEIQAH